jgi:hypothetical protein
MNLTAPNMGFYASWVGKTKLQPIAKPGIGSGLDKIAELLYLTSSTNFQSAAVMGRRNTNAQPA